MEMGFIADLILDDQWVYNTSLTTAYIVWFMSPPLTWCKVFVAFPYQLQMSGHLRELHYARMVCETLGYLVLGVSYFDC